MQAISYSFCMSLFHSLWQSALWLVFILAEKILSRQFTPGRKKNLLFVSIIVQFCLFIITFIFYQVQPAGSVSNLLYNTGLYDTTWQGKTWINTVPGCLQCTLAVLLNCKRLLNGSCSKAIPHRLCKTQY